MSYGLPFSQKALTQVNKQAHTDTHSHAQHFHLHKYKYKQYSDFTKGLSKGKKENIINENDRRIYFSIYSPDDNDKFVSLAA